MLLCVCVCVDALFSHQYACCGQPIAQWFDYKIKAWCLSMSVIMISACKLRCSICLVHLQLCLFSFYHRKWDVNCCMYERTNLYHTVSLKALAGEQRKAKRKGLAFFCLFVVISVTQLW